MVLNTGLTWRGESGREGGETWVDGPSNVRLGVKLSDPVQLIGLDVPAHLSPEDLASVLRLTVLDEPWAESALLGAPWVGAPDATRLTEALAALDSASDVYPDLLNPVVLMLDRALLVDEFGDRSAARSLVERMPNAVAEVVELLHDAEVDQSVTTNLSRLLQILDSPAAHLSAMAADVSDQDGPEWDVDATELPHREVLTLTVPPGFLDERTARRTEEVTERVKPLAWHTTRLVRAAGWIPDLAINDVARDLLDRLPHGTHDEELSAEIVQRTLAALTPERGMEPLLAELVAALLLSRADVGGALVRAVERDGGQD